jgi:membrane peptidoglycan carboxypeptidase
MKNEGGDTSGVSTLSEQQKKKRFWEESRQLEHKYNEFVFLNFIPMFL